MDEPSFTARPYPSGRIQLIDADAAAALPLVAGGPGNVATDGDGPADQQSNAARLQRVRRGAYVDRDGWEQLSANAQLLLLAHAISASAERGRLFSHCTAARAWGLPTVGKQQSSVEMLVADGRTGRSPGLIRRRTQNLPHGIELDGLCVTSPARTAVDIARAQSLASGVSVMDSVLTRGLASHDELRAELRAVPRGGRGRQLAALALALADIGGESAGESLSRVQLYTAGFPRPSLQVEFRDDRGFIGRVDMFWKELGVVGEFDGKTKYGVDDRQSSALAAGILWREKQREDRLRALGLTVVRWIWDDAWNATPMLRRLRAVGLRTGHSQQWPVPDLSSGRQTPRAAHS
ncbi:hypothetical protein [Allobranchiibius sp. GilTou38]|uniref:hypothetical protein n=1 Tax=Allobranchiibius sp. GilTou38 TaxID=2815210 RepID=UPI001AA0E071|nr:hypothetical protein [Allobranchiibius sp. GilTou38]MBO1767493.1 hypothetical protein [Allobranchiibius sp. GilTou38]